mgnify:CR=1 FL=1
MPSTHGFIQSAEEVLPGYVLTGEENEDQREAIAADKGRCLFIVAGPGSGKTTALALRALKLIYVDTVAPKNLLATTFTKKAAKELRSRILEWGERLRSTLEPDEEWSAEEYQNLDLNATRTGTLDSVAEEAIGTHRAPGEQPPVVIEEFVAQSLLLRAGLFQEGRFRREEFVEYLISLQGDNRRPDMRRMIDITARIRDRWAQDGVDLDDFAQNEEHIGAELVSDALRDYVKDLEERGVADFANLEERFLALLQADRLESLTEDLEALLVDEYQDTNLLQEKIYFELTKCVRESGGNISVVGDDDQSLYRFRGATVDLFESFPERVSDVADEEPDPIFLNNNYRSTGPIVALVNDFIDIDEAYQDVRVAGKPAIRAMRNVEEHPPVVGIFRDNVGELSHVLSEFVEDIFHGDGRRVGDYQISAGEDTDLGDCALLSYKVRERRSSGEARLPLHLRRDLRAGEVPLEVYNPRGRDIGRIDTIERLCGLLLECIDPDQTVEGNIETLTTAETAAFNRWRDRARAYIDEDPEPLEPRSLEDFVEGWRQRRGTTGGWVDEVQLSELIYKLVTWIPEFQDNIEGLVHLELVLRTVTQAATFSSYGCAIRFGEYEDNSINRLYRDVFSTIALGEVDVDEELLETLPTNRLNVLTVHQAKGLEFPMVIADIGSDFRSNHWTQAFARFPRAGSVAHHLENTLRQYSDGLEPPDRGARDRAFDDLFRQYYVAFSRARDLLVLTGLNPVRGTTVDGDETDTTVENVAAGWDRNGDWHWDRGLPNLYHI